MNICYKGHKDIWYEQGQECPACYVINDLKNKMYKLRESLDSSNEDCIRLECKVDQLESDLARAENNS